MGTVKTAIQLRIKRARQLVKGGAVQSNGKVGHFLVQSQSHPVDYSPCCKHTLAALIRLGVVE